MLVMKLQNNFFAFVSSMRHKTLTTNNFYEYYRNVSKRKVWELTNFVAVEAHYTLHLRSGDLKMVESGKGTMESKYI